MTTPAPWRTLPQRNRTTVEGFTLVWPEGNHGPVAYVATATDAQLMAAAPELLEAVRAGGRYSDALQRYQEHGVRGAVIPGTDELERLFKDWHDKGHAAIAKATASP